MATFTGTQYVISEDGGSTQTYTMQKQDTDVYLLKANNLSDIPNRNTARQNLGITVSPISPLAPEINDLWIDLDS
jgi:hypothetical protein